VCHRLSLLAVLFVPPAGAAEPFPFFEPVQPPRPVQVMVHRGLAGAAPENTRRAIEMCIEDDYEWVEIDVRLTKDGRHIVFHDNNLDGKSDGTGPVADHTLEQILALDGGKWFAPRFADEKLLTLVDALNIGKGKVNFYLDCKQIDPKLLVKEVILAGMEKQVIVYASPPVIAKVRDHSQKTIAVMTKWRPAMGDPVAFATEHDLAAVEIAADDITPQVVGQFKKAGVKTQAKVLGEKWDNPKTWKRVIEAGTDWLQTDKPLEVLMTSFRSRHPVWPVKVAYHRGARRYAPENTLPAIELAVALGADYIEIDIRTTKDGRFFLMHDATLERTTDGKGPLKELFANEVELLDAGAWFGRPYIGTKVPTLDAALTAIGDRSFAYLDCKDIAPASLAKILRDRNLLDRSVVYQSLEYLRQLKQIEPQVRAMPPLRTIADLPKVAEIKPFAVDATWRVLSKETIAKCHEKGILVFSDALGLHESIDQYRKAIEWGIDVIQTDHPARVLRAVELSLSKSMDLRVRNRSQPGEVVLNGVASRGHCW
jgi:glycerophosphoryl diester phosphodiesterase